MTSELIPISELIAKEPHLVPDLTFEAFWRECPRKIGKKAAERAWKPLSAEKRAAAIRGMAHHRDNNPQWRDQALIPHPSTFLNGERWNDDLTLTPQDEVIENQGKSPVDMAWSGLVQMFGKPMIDKYGKAPPAVWRDQLSKLTVPQVVRALQQTRDSGSEFPPSLPTFISYARTAPRLEPFKQLPKGVRNDALAFESLAEALRILGISK